MFSRNNKVDTSRVLIGRTDHEEKVEETLEQYGSSSQREYISGDDDSSFNREEEGLVSSSSSSIRPSTTQRIASSSFSNNQPQRPTNTNYGNAKAATKRATCSVGALLITLFVLLVLSTFVYFSYFAKSTLLKTEENQTPQTQSLKSIDGNQALVKLQPKISYQVHSWNDLRQWTQGYQKGVRHFKVDLYFHIDYEDFILAYGRACRRSESKKNHCLLLTHDAPIIDSPANGMFYFDYIDLIDTITEIRKKFGSSERIYVALCLKYAKYLFTSNAGTGRVIVGTIKNPCMPLPDYDWIILMDDMYQTFESRNEKLGLNTEFILDESGTPGGRKFLSRKKCVEGKWKNWPYTYISPRDPPEIMADVNTQSGNNWFSLVKSKEIDKYERFRYLNQPIYDDYTAKRLGLPSGTFFLEEAQKVSYGRFNNYEESKLLWEPSDQPDLHKTLQVYVKKPAAKGVLRFSSNIDPIQMETFISKYSKYGRNEYISDTKSAQKPKILVIDQSQLLVLFNKKNRLGYTIYNYDAQVSSPMAFISDGDGFSASNVVSLMKLSISNDAFGFRLLILLDSGKVNSYKFGKGLELDYTTSVPSLDGVNILSATVEEESKTLLVSYRGRKNQKTINIYNIADQKFTLINTINLKNLENYEITHLDLSAAVVTKDESIKFASDTLIIVIAFSTTDKNIHATYVTVPVEQLDAPTNLKSIKILGVGTQPATSTIKISRKIYSAIYWGEGFCSNSDKHNLQYYPYICSLKRLSCSNVLQYTFLTLQQLIDILDGNTGSQTFLNNRMNELNKISERPQLFHDREYSISPCTENILFGSYDRGSEPSVVLFKHDVEGQVMKSMSVHVGVSEKLDDSGSVVEDVNKLSTCASCGEAIPYNGIVIDEVLFSTKHLK